MGIVDQVFEHLKGPELLAALTKDELLRENTVTALALPVLVTLQDVHEPDRLTLLPELIQQEFAIAFEK